MYSLFRLMVAGAFLLGTLFSGAAVGQSKSPVAKGAQPVRLCDGFSFTEGPAADREGNLFFTDQPNNKIWKWSVDGKLSLFHESSGRANGLFFDGQGVLWSCSDQDNQIWSFDRQGVSTAYIPDGYNGKRLNGPNDLWVAPDGSIYLTDPYYKRPYWTHDGSKQQDSEQVYRLSPDRRELVRVTDDLVQPNGIIGAPDGKLLYVADIKAGKTWCYSIQPDGSLGGKTLFTGMGSDGMTIDRDGNIYLSGKGVTIFNPKGEKIGHIPIPANWTSNVSFGGKDRRTLFITASDALWSIRMRVKGGKR